jgi:hypothetical protein
MVRWAIGSPEYEAWAAKRPPPKAIVAWRGRQWERKARHKESKSRTVQRGMRESAAEKLARAEARAMLGLDD